MRPLTFATVVFLALEQNLLQLASILPKQGIGTKFVKKTWTDPGFFWTLDRVAYGKVSTRCAARAD